MRGTGGGERLDLALEGEPSPGKGRGVVPLGGDQGLEPAHAFEPRRGDRDAEFGRLAFDRVQPGGVARALLEQAIAPAQRPLELSDPRGVARVDGENELVEEAAPLARRDRKTAYPSTASARRHAHDR